MERGGRGVGEGEGSLSVYLSLMDHPSPRTVRDPGPDPAQDSRPTLMSIFTALILNFAVLEMSVNSASLRRF